MKQIDHMRGIEYEAIQEFITQLIAYLSSSKRAKPIGLQTLDRAIDQLMELKKGLSVDDDLESIREDLVDRARQWNFPQVSI